MDKWKCRCRCRCRCRWQMDKADKRLVHRAVSCVRGEGGVSGGSHAYPGTSIIYVCQYFCPVPLPLWLHVLHYLSIHSVKYCLSLRDSLTGFQLDCSWDPKSSRVNERMWMRDCECEWECEWYLLIVWRIKFSLELLQFVNFAVH